MPLIRETRGLETFGRESAMVSRLREYATASQVKTIAQRERVHHQNPGATQSPDYHDCPSLFLS